MNDIFQRAAAGLTLAPWERAALKTLGGVLIAGLTAGVAYVIAALTRDPVIADLSWIAVLGVIIKTVFDAVGKLLATSGNPLARAAAPVVEEEGGLIASQIGAALAKNPS